MNRKRSREALQRFCRQSQRFDLRGRSGFGEVKEDCRTTNRLIDAIEDHRARAAAVRALSFWLDRVDNPIALLTDRINDEHPRVRLEAVRALSFLEGDEAIEAALGVLEHDIDDYLQYTLDETMRVLE